MPQPGAFAAALAAHLKILDSCALGSSSCAAATAGMAEPFNFGRMPKCQQFSWSPSHPPARKQGDQQRFVHNSRHGKCWGGRQRPVPARGAAEPSTHCYHLRERLTIGYCARGTFKLSPVPPCRWGVVVPPCRWGNRRARAILGYRDRAEGRRVDPTAEVSPPQAEQSRGSQGKSVYNLPNLQSLSSPASVPMPSVAAA